MKDASRRKPCRYLADRYCSVRAKILSVDAGRRCPECDRCPRYKEAEG